MNEEMKKFENVARYLDGEDLQLNDEEQALLEEFRSDESAVAEKLAPEFQPELTQLINDKLSPALTARQKRSLIIPMVRWTAVAAVLIIILTAAVLWQKSVAPDSSNQPGAVAQSSVQSVDNINTGDSSEDEINAFLTPLFYDENAQAILNNDLSEQELLDVYLEDGDSVMLSPASPSQA